MSHLCTVVLDFSPQFEWNSVYDQDRLWVSSCLCCFACNKPKLFLSRQSGEDFGAGNLWSACKSGVCMSLHWIRSVLYVLNGVKHVGPNFQVLGSSTTSADWKPIWAFCSLKYYLFVCLFYCMSCSREGFLGHFRTIYSKLDCTCTSCAISQHTLHCALILWHTPVLWV